MRLLFILIGACSLLVSCKKERTIHITAKNAVTGVPYSGLTYYVVQEMTSGDGEKTKTVATGTLDGNGEAHLTKKLPKAYSYTVRVEAPANTCYNKQIAFHFANQETAFECAFEFAECAYLKLHVHNTNCIDSNDQIKFRRLSLSVDESNDFVEQYGCFQYDGDYFKLPMGSYKYEWIVTKNGVTNNYESSFQLTEDQYYDFQLDY